MLFSTIVIYLIRGCAGYPPNSLAATLACLIASKKRFYHDQRLVI